MKPAVRQLLMGRSGPSLSRYGRTRPLYMSHRGNSLLGPEETLEAYRYSLECGAPVLEGDVYLLSDGAMGMMHDSTVDRTTTGTGAVSTFSTATWRALAIDAETQNIWGFGNAVAPAVFPDVLSEFRGRAIFAPELKVAGAKVPMIQALSAAGIRKDQAIVSASVLANLDAVVAAGYPAMFVMDATAAALASNLTDAAAAGINWVAIDSAAPDATLTSWVNGGFNVITYTVNRRNRRDQLLALGVVGFVSDDAPYLSGEYVSTVSAWGNGKFMPGQIAANNATVMASRGVVSSGGWWGWSDISVVAGGVFVLQGWAGIMRPSFTIDYEMRINAVNAADTTRWGSLFLADSSMGDTGFTDSNLAGEKGYSCALRKSGQLAIFRSNGGTTTTIATAATAALADGETAKLRITKTPTNISFQRISTADGTTVLGTASIADSNYGSGYIHFGRSLSIPEFRNVAIS